MDHGVRLVFVSLLGFGLWLSYFPPTRIYRFHGIPITRLSISPQILRNAPSPPLVAITTTLILSSTPNLEALRSSCNAG